MNKKGFIDDWLPLLPLGFAMLLLIIVAVSCDIIKERTYTEHFTYYSEVAEASFRISTIFQQPFPQDCTWLTEVSLDEPHQKSQQLLKQLLHNSPHFTNGDAALLSLHDTLKLAIADQGSSSPLNNPSSTYFVN